VEYPPVTNAITGFMKDDHFKANKRKGIGIEKEGKTERPEVGKKKDKINTG
jgi:hypothetical protein